MEVASYSLSGEAERILDSTVVQEYAYVYNGSSLMQMVVRTTVDDGEPVTETLYFSYDASGIPMSLVYNGTDYYYTVSLQGDVTAILNTSGTTVVEYTYDAWGNILSVTGSMADTLGAVNPLTYRGYVYDTETGLYYLQSRYYNPETGRFINADGYLATGQGLLGNNMFAYCLNNPVFYCDKSGNSAAVAAIVAPGAYEAFMAFLATVASSNAWNVVGWAAAAILATGIITIGAMYLYDWFMESRQSSSPTAVSSATTSGAAAPPPDNKNNKNRDTRYRGGSTYNKDGIRVDYEYYGNGKGNVHLHKNQIKYKYDTQQDLFMYDDGTLAPKSIQRLLDVRAIVYAIQKALEYISNI